MVVCLATHVCHVVESKVRLVVSVIYVNTIGVRIQLYVFAITSIRIRLGQDVEIPMSTNKTIYLIIFG